MSILCRCLGISLFLIVGTGAPRLAESEVIIFEIDSSSAINFSSNPPSFTLTFPDFRTGARTNRVDVIYSVVANDVVRANDVVFAKLDDLFPNISLQARLGTYTKRSGNASLVAVSPGWVTVTTQDTGLANKVTDSGDGKMVDGTFGIGYQAEAIQDLVSGQHYQTLTVTFSAV